MWRWFDVIYQRHIKVDATSWRHIDVNVALVRRQVPAGKLLYPATIFVLKMSSDFYVCFIYSSALQATCLHGSKHYEPWLDWSKRAVWSRPILFRYRLPKNISRRDDRRQYSMFNGCCHIFIIKLNVSNTLWNQIELNFVINKFTPNGNYNSVGLKCHTLVWRLLSLLTSQRSPRGVVDKCYAL